LPLQAQGEFAQVKEKLERSMGLSGQPVKRGTMAHEHIVYMMLVDSAATARDQNTILKYAPILEKLATRDDHRPYLAIAHRAYGIAHRLSMEYDHAESRLQHAFDIFEELDLPWQRGRTLYELGELAQIRNNHEISRQLFTQALQEFERLGATADVVRTKAVLET
jgi:tetratricopeptide (TPR) repeat protein